MKVKRLDFMKYGDLHIVLFAADTGRVIATGSKNYDGGFKIHTPFEETQTRGEAWHRWRWRTNRANWHYETYEQALAAIVEELGLEIVQHEFKDEFAKLHQDAVLLKARGLCGSIYEDKVCRCSAQDGKHEGPHIDGDHRW